MNKNTFDVEGLMAEFPVEMRDMVRENGTAKLIFNLMLHGESPHHSIVRLLKMIEDYRVILENAINMSVPKGFVLTDKDFKALREMMPKQ